MFDTHFRVKVPCNSALQTIGNEKRFVIPVVDLIPCRMSATEEEYLSAVDLKVKGNEAFKKEDYKTALKYYCMAIGYIGMNSNVSLRRFVTKKGENNPFSYHNCYRIERQTDILRITLFNNMAQVHIKMQQYDLAVQKTSRVLDEGSQIGKKVREKALFRRAMAFRKLEQHQQAQSDLDSLECLLSTDSIPDLRGIIVRERRLLAEAVRNNTDSTPLMT